MLPLDTRRASLTTSRATSITYSVPGLLGWMKDSPNFSALVGPLALSSQPYAPLAGKLGPPPPAPLSPPPPPQPARKTSRQAEATTA